MRIMSEKDDILLTNLDGLNTRIKRNREEGWPDIPEHVKLMCMVYVQEYSISAASKASKIGVTKAKTLLRNPLIAAYLKTLQEIYGARSVIDRDFVAVQWMKLLPMVMGEEAVNYVSQHGETMQLKKFHASEAVRALTEISKATDFFNDAMDSGDAQPLNIQFNVSEPKKDVRITKT